MCTMGSDFIIVSGSDVKTTKGAAQSVEAYNIRDDRWEMLPDLNFGRDTHGSCSFNDHIHRHIFGFSFWPAGTPHR